MAPDSSSSGVRGNVFKQWLRSLFVLVLRYSPALGQCLATFTYEYIFLVLEKKISKGGLHIIQDGKLKAQRYAHDILRPYVVAFTAVIGDTFQVMQTNARPFTADLIKNFLEAETC
ncbi:hypothetical protein TNCV_4175681 [Trichonephila clavipes]|nr:hypothetical protein TNCV_4175681 [Trichonephila clavipes]